MMSKAYHAGKAAEAAEDCLIGMVCYYSREPIWSQITSAMRDVPMIKFYTDLACLDVDYDVFPRRYGFSLDVLREPYDKFEIVRVVCDFSNQTKWALRKSIFNLCMDVVWKAGLRCQ